MKKLSAQARYSHAVDGVSSDRAADGGEVHPDLVGAPCVQGCLNQGVGGEMLYHLVEGMCLPPVRYHRHTLSVSGMPTDWGIYGTFLWRGATFYQHQVPFDYTAVLHLGGKFEVGGLVLGNYHEAGGIFVEAMHNAGSKGAVNGGDIRTMSQDGIHQRVTGVPRCRMNGDISRLVDHQDIIVLVDDGEGNILGDEGWGSGGGGR